MSNQSNNNKRIAKNTLLLYFRMLFMMVVSLYTSRVILNALGVEDFGIYNVVGGVVTIQLLLSLIIVVLIESVGVWFLNAKMTIPAERMTAANRVLQFSIVTFVIALISVPYNSAIIAHFLPNALYDGGVAVHEPSHIECIGSGIHNKIIRI